MRQPVGLATHAARYSPYEFLVAAAKPERPRSAAVRPIICDSISQERHDQVPRPLGIVREREVARVVKDLDLRVDLTTVREFFDRPRSVGNVLPGELTECGPPI